MQAEDGHPGMNDLQPRDGASTVSPDQQEIDEYSPGQHGCDYVSRHQ